MNITIINGSTAIKSHTKSLIAEIESTLTAKGCSVTIWDLATIPLPIAVPEYHNHPQTFSPLIEEFIATITQADGIILGTPLYHGSYSGVLKNSLDWLLFNTFFNKPVGLVVNGGSERAAVSAVDHLRSVVRALYGYSLQHQIVTGPNDYQDLNDQFQLSSDDIKNRIDIFTSELINLAEFLKQNPPNIKG